MGLLGRARLLRMVERIGTCWPSSERSRPTVSAKRLKLAKCRVFDGDQSCTF